ncbi:carbohydrate binding family 9 domain-containing protein [Algoriphagus aestuariicola]|uniref:Carbohydrate binding family 9 domain-containing protein n=1 Tax=Algoriphagus aestuariicola TaxID=1852016 RepID=A0ABS3BSP6_9BACT|nr:carbohydrate binding family 9 domain-containing protein [Algoriphagus aestuariicola]MBN7802307.1 carbohydrate binding family 9 domain-containing protein [Algoriphagus aestuariicola]
MKLRLLLPAVLCLALPVLAIGQSGLESNAFAFKLKEPVILDGELSETIWTDSEGWNGNFRQYFPSDTSESRIRTRVKIAFDDQNLYIAAVMENLGPRNYVSTSLRRDFRGEQNDAIVFVLDTFNDKTNAFSFGINPYGVQREGLISNGGSKSEDLSLAWDNKWFSEAKIFENHWQAEMIIPLSTIRFSDGAQNWNVNFYRIDSEYGERSTWTPIPRNFPILTLAYSRKLIFEEPLKKNSANISLIPYTAARTSKNFIEGTEEELTPSFGGDAKIGIGPALNLDLTFNPDFSQVEVDQQVTNLDRFEIFFPERRQFFLENADLFDSFGQMRSRPFFSRRIGVDIDSATGQNVQSKIIYGARLSGKITEDWRIGLMNMQTATDEEAGISGKNFTVMALQKKVFTRSNIGLIFVDRESLAVDEFQQLFDPSAYNRLIGVDYNLNSADGKWTGKVFYHRTFESRETVSPYSFNAYMLYSDVHWAWSFSYQDIGQDFNPLVGFVPRVNFKRLNPDLAYLFYPKSKLINRHGPKVEFEGYWNEDIGQTDRDINLGYLIRFNSFSELAVTQKNRYIYLFQDFDPTRTGGVPLAAGSDYYNKTVQLEYKSNPRNRVNLELDAEAGQYYTGNFQRVTGQMGLRMGYLANVSMNFNYARIRLPEPQSDADLILVGPRIDLTVTKKLFWTTFVQYNNQIDNININTRFQWRYAPVSDFFLVYTDNYFPGDFVPKQRSLVLKLNYWLNL